MEHHHLEELRIKLVEYSNNLKFLPILSPQFFTRIVFLLTSTEMNGFGTNLSSIIIVASLEMFTIICSTTGILVVDFVVVSDVDSDVDTDFVSMSTSSVIKASTVVVLLEYLGLRVVIVVVVVVVSFCATD